MLFPDIPVVAVILPTFNRGHCILSAVASVVQQTFTKWELVIVDDGGTDNTAELLAPLMEKDSRIRYMKQRNRGAPRARNAGMDNSFSEFVTFIDSDDLYLPDHLASRVEIMRRNPSLDLLSGGFSGDTDIYVPDYRDPENMVHISECILCGTMFGDRRMFEELDGFADIAYAEDTDLWQRALQHGFNVRKIDGPETYVYRQSDDSITRNFTPP